MDLLNSTLCTADLSAAVWPICIINAPWAAEQQHKQKGFIVKQLVWLHAADCTNWISTFYRSLQLSCRPLGSDWDEYELAHSPNLNRHSKISSRDTQIWYRMSQSHPWCLQDALGCTWIHLNKHPYNRSGKAVQNPMQAQCRIPHCLEAPRPSEVGMLTSTYHMMKAKGSILVQALTFLVLSTNRLNFTPWTHCIFLLLQARVTFGLISINPGSTAEENCCDVKTASSRLFCIPQDRTEILMWIPFLPTKYFSGFSSPFPPTHRGVEHSICKKQTAP